MPYYVYIIQSSIDGSFYKGFTEDPLLRLQRHNNGETASTRHLCPWTLVYVEELLSKTEALKREKLLKKLPANVYWHLSIILKILYIILPVSMPPVIPTAVWGRVRVPSGPQKLLKFEKLFCFMPYYVYIIQSSVDGSFYKGLTEDPLLRLQRHNNGETASTRHICPWILVYVEELLSKTETLKEKRN